MITTRKKSPPETPTKPNYFFLLNCLAGIAGVAIASAATVATFAASHAAALGASIAAKSLLATSVLVSTPWLLPSIIATVLIGSLCILPFVLCANCRMSSSIFSTNRSFDFSVPSGPPYNSVTTVASRQPSSNIFSWFGRNPYAGGNHHPAHGRGQSSHPDAHGSGGHTSSNVHGRGGHTPSNVHGR